MSPTKDIKYSALGTLSDEIEGLYHRDFFEFTCQYGQFRICGGRCEQHLPTRWVRIDQGNPDKISPAIKTRLQAAIKSTKHRLRK